MRLSAALLSYTNQDDLLIGTPMACRNSPSLQHMVGNLVNVVILRANLMGDPTFSELVQRMRKVSASSNAVDLYHAMLTRLLCHPWAS